MLYYTRNQEKKGNDKMKTYYCPTYDTSCPYCKGDDCICTIGNPLEECDDYYYYNGEDEENE